MYKPGLGTLDGAKVGFGDGTGMGTRVGNSVGPERKEHKLCERENSKLKKELIGTTIVVSDIDSRLKSQKTSIWHPKSGIRGTNSQKSSKSGINSLMTVLMTVDVLRC